MLVSIYSSTRYRLIIIVSQVRYGHFFELLFGMRTSSSFFCLLVETNLKLHHSHLLCLLLLPYLVYWQLITTIHCVLLPPGGQEFCLCNLNMFRIGRCWFPAEK